MMDAQLQFCDAQSVAAAVAGSTDSTDWVYIPQVTDHTGTSRNDRPNVSGRNHLNIVIEDEAFAGSGSVVTFQLYADSDATTITTDGDVIVTTSVTVGASGLADGYQICSIPLPITTFKPYLQLKTSVSVADLTAGKITAFIGTPLQQGGEHGAL